MTLAFPCPVSTSLPKRQTLRVACKQFLNKFLICSSNQLVPVSAFHTEIGYHSAWSWPSLPSALIPTWTRFASVLLYSVPLPQASRRSSHQEQPFSSLWLPLANILVLSFLFWAKHVPTALTSLFSSGLYCRKTDSCKLCSPPVG